MKKFLLVLVVGGAVAAAVAYFGMQWRLQKSADEFFSAMMFVDADYEDIGIDLNGNISLRNLELFVPGNQLNIDVSQISLSTGGLWNTLMLEKRLEDGKLPEQLNLKIGRFSMALDPSMITALDAFYVPDELAQLQALGCGRTIAFGPQAYYDMGIQFLTFDLDVGYRLNAPSGELVSTTDLYIDGVSHLRIDQTFLGMENLIGDYRSLLTRFDPNALTPVNLSVEYVDLGYNAKRLAFCAQESGLTQREWQQLHLSMVAAALDQIGFDSDFDAVKLYSDLMDQRVRASLSLQPLPGFNMAELAFYDVGELLDVLGLLLVVNNEEVDVNYISWDDNALDRLDLADIRQAFRVGPEEENVFVDPEEAESVESPTRRMLVEVPVSGLEQHLNRQVLIERENGTTFTGELIEVSGNRVVVRTRFTSGYTDLPLRRDDFATVKLYPED